MGRKTTKPDDIVRKSALAECKTCKNLSGIPLLELEARKEGCATF